MACKPTTAWSVEPASQLANEAEMATISVQNTATSPVIAQINNFMRLIPFRCDSRLNGADWQRIY